MILKCIFLLQLIIFYTFLIFVFPLKYIVFFLPECVKCTQPRLFLRINQSSITSRPNLYIPLLRCIIFMGIQYFYALSTDSILLFVTAFSVDWTKRLKKLVHYFLDEDCTLFLYQNLGYAAILEHSVAILT